MARGVPKDPQKRQAQIEHGKQLAELHKQNSKIFGGRSKPTIKEKQLVTKFVNNGFNGGEAAMSTYNTKSKRNARSIAKQVLSKPHVQKELIQQLNDKGLGIDDLNDYTKELISINMDGKPSQAVAASMIQFAYKLHNALPATKKMNMNLSLHDQLPSKDMDDLKKTLEDLQKTNNALIAAIEGKK